MINLVVHEFLPQCNEYHITVENKTPQHIPRIIADQGKLQRVMNNLLDNAIKFTPDGGEINIKVECNDTGVVVRVEDSGPGIPEEYRERIFERFVQVPGQRSRRRGTGLGLTFCQSVIEAHGGHIWVEPRPGGGSIFFFTLPYKNAEGLSHL